MTKMGKDSTTCQCKKNHHKGKRVVITGGPGAGKTAVLEMVRHVLCPMLQFYHGISIPIGIS